YKSFPCGAVRYMVHIGLSNRQLCGIHAGERSALGFFGSETQSSTQQQRNRIVRTRFACLLLLLSGFLYLLYAEQQRAARDFRGVDRYEADALAGGYVLHGSKGYARAHLIDAAGVRL